MPMLRLTFFATVLILGGCFFNFYDPMPYADWSTQHIVDERIMNNRDDSIAVQIELTDRLDRYDRLAADGLVVLHRELTTREDRSEVEAEFDATWAHRIERDLAIAGDSHARSLGRGTARDDPPPPFAYALETLYTLRPDLRDPAAFEHFIETMDIYRPASPD